MDVIYLFFNIRAIHVFKRDQQLCGLLLIGRSTESPGTEIGCGNEWMIELIDLLRTMKWYICIYLIYN